MGLSPGLDFESQLFVKTNIKETLIAELSKANYLPRPIALGTNTDPYQPIERKFQNTRAILEVFRDTRHPVTIVTKSALIVRDIDILVDLAQNSLVHVALSVTSLDRKLARKLEPRASTPLKRIEALEQLHAANIPTAVMVAPVIPAINDHEIEAILDRCAQAGVSQAAYVLLRLPLELKEIFEEWLDTDFPDRKNRVFSILKSMRNGQLYNANWGERMAGNGPYADLIAQRFKLAAQRSGISRLMSGLRTDLFKPPGSRQLSLF